MHRFLAVFVCLAGLASPIHAQGVFESYQPLDLQQVLAAEMDSLEGRYSICFPDSCRPMIRLGTMDELHGGLQIGLYQAESTQVIIHPAYGLPQRFELLFASHEDVYPMMLGVIDHELGHAYADWASRTTQDRIWPFAYIGQPIASSLGLTIQSEGIASTFERGLLGPTFQPRWWPECIDTTQFGYGTPTTNTLAYHGGYQLVGSLAARHGLAATVDYIVDHPLVIDPSAVRESVTCWYNKADQELAIAK